jgi:hypothetical protein
MKVYIYTESFYNQQDSCICKAVLVQAEIQSSGEAYGVHHPETGYSVWPADQFKESHRELTAKERQLINFTTAELEVMGISDGQPPAEDL